MPGKDEGWPIVGFIPTDHDDHGLRIEEEARILSNYGAISDDLAGRPCPYQTLNAFCQSVKAYIGTQHQPELMQGLRFTQNLPDRDNFGEKQPLSRSEHHGTRISPESMHIQGMTYCVLALDPPLDFRTSHQQDAIDAIVGLNKGFIAGIEIKSVMWRGHRRQDPFLEIEFARPEQANAAIREGILVGDRPLRCKKVPRDHMRRCCDRCGGYGHFSKRCYREHLCVFCAQPHEWVYCPVQELKEKWRCIQCYGPHQTFDEGCPVQQACEFQVRQTVDGKQKYFHEPGRLQSDVDNAPSVIDTFPTRLAEFISEYGLRGGNRGRLRYALGYDDEWIGEEDQETLVTLEESPRTTSRVNGTMKEPRTNGTIKEPYINGTMRESHINGTMKEPIVVNLPSETSPDSPTSLSEDSKAEPAQDTVSLPALSDEDDVLQGPTKNMSGFEIWLRRRKSALL